MGTSLKVNPFASLPSLATEEAARLLINREEVGDFDFDHEGNYRDVFMEGDVDVQVLELATRCGWEKELDRIYQEIRSNKLQTWEVDRCLETYSTAAEDSILRSLTALAKEGSITEKEATRYSSHVKERPSDLVEAYLSYVENGEDEAWLRTLTTLAQKLGKEKTSQKTATKLATNSAAATQKPGKASKTPVARRTPPPGKPANAAKAARRIK